MTDEYKYLSQAYDSPMSEIDPDAAPSPVGELVAQQLRIMADAAKDSPDGWAYLNPHGRECIRSAADRISQLEAALRFYADGDSWRTRGHPQIDWNEKPVLHDGGKLAREVLGVSEEEFLKRLRG